MKNFTLDIKELARLEARMTRTGVNQAALYPVCMVSGDCGPKDYKKAACHGCNEIVKL